MAVYINYENIIRRGSTNRAHEALDRLWIGSETADKRLVSFASRDVAYTFLAFIMVKPYEEAHCSLFSEKECDYVAHLLSRENIFAAIGGAPYEERCRKMIAYYGNILIKSGDRFIKNILEPAWGVFEYQKAVENSANIPEDEREEVIQAFRAKAIEKLG